jgi:hypothetical protein
MIGTSNGLGLTVTTGGSLLRAASQRWRYIQYSISIAIHITMKMIHASLSAVYFEHIPNEPVSMLLWWPSCQQLCSRRSERLQKCGCASEVRGLKIKSLGQICLCRTFRWVNIDECFQNHQPIVNSRPRAPSILVYEEMAFLARSEFLNVPSNGNCEEATRRFGYEGRQSRVAFAQG